MRQTKQIFWFFVILMLILGFPGSTQEIKQELIARIDTLSPQLLEINEWLYHNPEVGHQEFKAVEKITGFLK